MGDTMDKAKAYVATSYEHGQRWHYYGESAEEALSNARARTLTPNWPTIYVARIPQKDDAK